MNELLFYRIALGAAGILFALFAAWTFRLSPGNLSRFEAWPRRRLPGMLIGWAALAICVPHAEVVSPGFLVPLLWPLAIAVPILGYFFVDYPLARALGGISILGAYSFIHKSFEWHTPLLGALVVPAWIFGIAGIWVSGKPCALRDWIRLCAGSKTWRSVSAAFWCILTLALFWSAAMTTGE